MAEYSEDALHAAVAARKAGNKALVAGNVEEAYTHYTKGLEAVPTDYLLLGNRSEALLVRKQAQEALADAAKCIECSEGKWSKGYLRKANAEVALGLTREAIRTLRDGLRILAPTDNRQPWLDKISNVKQLHLQVRVETNPNMGRVLVTNSAFTMGREVLSELPTLRWRREKKEVQAPNVASKPLSTATPTPPQPTEEDLRNAGVEDASSEATVAPSTPAAKEPAPKPPVYDDPEDQASHEEIKRVCAESGVAANFAGPLVNFVKMSPEEQDIVLSCCCPSVPMSHAVVHLIMASQKIASIPRFAALGQQKIVRLMMINKVNTHAIFDDESAIFEVASKMAHSCAPNCMYDGTGLRWFSMKNIAKDQLVTFSYNASRYALHSAELRQTILRETHLFVCKCERCVGIDTTRGIRCDCGKGTSQAYDHDDAIRFRLGTTKIDAERGVPDAKSWSCKACGGRWSDNEMSKLLERESAIEAEVYEMEKLSDKLEKGQYEKLKGLLERSMQYLSKDHWCYLLCCKLLAMYHYQVARGSRASASELLELAILWGKKYSSGLVRTKVAEYCPLVYSEWDYWMALVCGSWPHLMQEKIALLESVYPTYSTLFPKYPQTAEIAETLAKAKQKITTYRNKVFLGKAYKNLHYEYDESELFERWENHLADRYLQSVREQPDGKLQELLREHTDPSAMLEKKQ
eukprot:TRINITY_DN16535_c0_g1_i1.p1 TRINITY_DN16535_c0_g1~~TRINITY_DN16535_c0_g1_i1.p1  ORF type:complete len:691 (+),score=224.35 TRINITY_DN16535_c0_g1_i1:60-2132(+)